MVSDGQRPEEEGEMAVTRLLVYLLVKIQDYTLKRVSLCTHFNFFLIVYICFQTSFEIVCTYVW